MKIAILGGSFNPPHLAHQMACLYLLEGEGFGQVWLVPTYKHPFSKLLAQFVDRMEMCRLLAKPFDGRVMVSDLESSLATDRGNRTADTVDALKERHPKHSFTLVIGSDLLSETSKWKDIQRLRREISFLVLLRSGHVSRKAGWKYSSLVLPKVASTTIRQTLKTGQSVRGLLPESVRDYIESHGLYDVIRHGAEAGCSSESR